MRADRYRVLPQSSYRKGAISVRSIRSQDIEPIRNWRNAQVDILRQSGLIEPEAQVRYFESRVWPEMDKPEPAQVLLAIEHDENLIGYGGLTNISWVDRRAEISFLLDAAIEPDAQRRETYFGVFLQLIRDIAFRELGLNRVFTETFAHRLAHIATLESSGFVLEGRLREHILVNGVKTDFLMHGSVAGEWET